MSLHMIPSRHRCSTRSSRKGHHAKDLFIDHSDDRYVDGIGSGCEHTISGSSRPQRPSLPIWVLKCSLYMYSRVEQMRSNLTVQSIEYVQVIQCDKGVDFFTNISNKIVAG